jgi:serine/threonine protein kinase
VLLSSDYVAKVSDFGLSRDLENESYYTSHGGQVPVRWTAIEALEDRKYSTASDVWSFGITVFEMFTNCEIPYKGWSNSKVWLQVKEGYRLPCHPSISDEAYAVLLLCWDEVSLSKLDSFFFLLMLSMLAAHESTVWSCT